MLKFPNEKLTFNQLCLEDNILKIDPKNWLVSIELLENLKVLK